MKYQLIRREPKYIVRRLICLILLCILLVSVSIACREVINYCLSLEGTSISKDDFWEYPVVVKKGDTAWGIQSELISERYDIREVLFEVEKINGISLGKIKEGDVIIFLKEKK